MHEFFEYITLDLIYILRIVLATACGALIGVERSKRFKEAGIRTHVIVAVGAALIMIISIQFKEQPSRIAAQIVTGIGFLGAGMIFFRRESLHGLTTAAGIWVTAGIGMSAGAGLYVVTVFTTIFLSILQIIFHTQKFGNRHKYNLFYIKFDYTAKTVAYLKSTFDVQNFARFRAEENGDKISATAVVRTKRVCDTNEIVHVIASNKNIHSIERLEDL